MAKRSSRSASNAAASLGPGTRIAILHGKERFLRQRYTDELIEALEGAGERPDVLRFDGMTATAAEILDECRSMGLLATHKVIVVDNAEELVKAEAAGAEASGAESGPARGGRRRKAPPTRRAMFERYAESPSEGATLVLRAETWRAGKLDKLVEKVGAVVKCEVTDPIKAADWCVMRANKEHGRAMGQDAAQLLVRRIGTDLSRLDTELGKLAAAAGAGEGEGEITTALIGELVGLSSEEQAWAIQQVLLGADAEVILAKLDELLHVARQHHVPIRYAFGTTAAKLATAAALLETGAPPGAVQRSIGLWPEAARRFVDAAGKMSPEDAAGLLAEVIRADVRAKTSVGDPERGLEMLGVRFARLTG